MHDDDDILRDGQRVRVPMMLKDSSDGSDMHKHPTLHDGRGGKPGRRPGFVLADRAAIDERQAAYCEYEDSLTTAWRNDATARVHFVRRQWRADAAQRRPPGSQFDDRRGLCRVRCGTA
jgi:hypothetical protein